MIINHEIWECTMFGQTNMLCISLGFLCLFDLVFDSCSVVLMMFALRCYVFVRCIMVSLSLSSDIWYCGWLRNHAPPNANLDAWNILKPYKQGDVVPTVFNRWFGFRNHPQYDLLGMKIWSSVDWLRKKVVIKYKHNYQ